MKFQMGETPVTLQGNSSFFSSLISLKAMFKAIKGEGEAILLELCNMTSSDQQPQDLAIPKPITQLLQEYADVFAKPTTLPPVRARDHSIVLQPGSSPVNVRSYRYPYHHKSEIERLVRDMLSTGIIQPNVSPFSSPALIVKKKNGGWQFCTDYKSLNKVIVLDKFPIPIVDELLDEIHGATIFFKLDLKSGYHHIRARQQDIPKTTLRTYEGHYELLVMPFDLSNAPATFQGLMNQVFHEYLRKIVLGFFMMSLFTVFP